MKINKKELLKKLEDTKPGLANKDIIEFTNAFSFTGKYITTFNDEISVFCPLKSDIKGTVIAKEFFTIVNKIAPDKDGNLVIEKSEECDELIITGKRVQAGILFDPEGALPLDEIKAEGTWNKLPDDFIKALQLCSFCVSNDQSILILNCIQIIDNCVISTNKFRAFKYKLNEKMTENFLLPANYVSPLSNYQIKEYNITTDWIHFKTKDDVIISARIYPDDEYPDINFLFDPEGNEIITFPEITLSALEKSVIFCDNVTQSESEIEVDVQKKKIVIKSQDKNIGWITEKIIHKNNTQVNFTINAFFLQDILNTTKKGKFGKVGENNVLSFIGKNWNHVILVKV